jgi:HTH-type transcriptional regulator / antitoxin HigA
MGNKHHIPVEVFPPGEFIRDELEARGWEQRDLAEIMGRPERVVSELISGKRSLTAETAQQLGEAFGTSAEVWLNLEAVYQLHKLGKPDEAVSRRARLYTAAPIKDMVRRGWIVESDNVEVMESRVMRFFAVDSLDARPNFFSAAARKSTSYVDEFTPAQQAWLFRARQLARTLKPSKFDARTFPAEVLELRSLLANPEDVRQVPKALASLGVRCVVVEHLPETRIDGACFWLDSKSPVVALSLRFDRIDSFWFTLMHELGHVTASDGRDEALRPDIDLIVNAEAASKDEVLPPEELAANQFASSFLLPLDEFKGFIGSVKPFFSKQKIEEFAALHKIHPGLVVGQLQHQRLIPFANLRSSLVKVRSTLLETVLYDGWGMTPPHA